MIGVDTNILLRLFIDDDPEQQKKAVAFFAIRTADDPAYVGLVAILEFIWLLSQRYGYARQDIVNVIGALLQSVNIQIEQPEIVFRAVDIFEKSGADMADILMTLFNQDAGCDKTVTFDKRAAKAGFGMDLLR